MGSMGTSDAIGGATRDKYSRKRPIRMEKIRRKRNNRGIFRGDNRRTNIRHINRKRKRSKGESDSKTPRPTREQ